MSTNISLPPNMIFSYNIYYKFKYSAFRLSIAPFRKFLVPTYTKNKIAWSTGELSA